MLKPARWLSEDAISCVDARDLLEMAVEREQDGADVGGTGGDVEILDGEDDAFPVESPGEFESLFPAPAVGGNVKHGGASGAEPVEVFPFTQAAPDLGDDQAAGRDIARFRDGRKATKGIASLARKANVPGTVDENRPGHFFRAVDQLFP